MSDTYDFAPDPEDFYGARERRQAATVSEFEDFSFQDKLNDVYAQRNALAVAFAKAALAAGWGAGRGFDQNMQAGDLWGHVVYVDLPDGRQVSWHMSPDSVPLLEGLPEYPYDWDGSCVGKDPEWVATLKTDIEGLI